MSLDLAVESFGTYLIDSGVLISVFPDMRGICGIILHGLPYPDSFDHGDTSRREPSRDGTRGKVIKSVC